MAANRIAADIAEGGPAFPAADMQRAHEIAAAAVIGVEDSNERDRVYTLARAAAVRGMTLRQWYAGLAMQGLLANDGEGPFESREENARYRARVARRMADALVKEMATGSAS